MSKLNLLEDLLDEAKRAHELSESEIKKSQKKVFGDLKRGLKTFMTRPTVAGNVESATAKALKLKVFELKDPAGKVEDAMVETTNKLHSMVVQLRKKSGKNFANINEAPKFVPAQKALGDVGPDFDDLEVTTVEIGGESSFLAGWVDPDGKWGVLLTNKPKTRGPDVNRLLAKGKASSAAAGRKAVVIALAKQAKKHDNRSR
jgi:hypothetical protein